jgi:methyl-accepting chemotaxis protein
MLNKLSLKIKLPAIMILIISAALIITVLVNTDKTMTIMEKEARYAIKETGGHNAVKIKEIIENSFIVVRSLAQTFEGMLQDNNMVSRKTALKMLKHILSENKDILGVCTGWEPNAFDGKDDQFKNTKGHDGTGRFIPYYARSNGNISLSALADYDKPGAGDYYLKPVQTKREQVIEPYKYEVNGKEVLMISVVAPIIHNGRAVGIVAADMALDKINEIVSALAPYQVGYAALFSNNSTAVSHPDKALIGNQLPADKYSEMIETIKQGKESVKKGKSYDAKREVIRAFIPFTLGSTKEPWSLMISVPMSKIMESAYDLQRSSFYLGLLAIFIAAIIGFTFSNSITSPLVNAVLNLGKVTNDGDTTVRVSSDLLAREDEIGALSKAVQSLVEQQKNQARLASLLAEGDWRQEVQIRSPKDELGKAFSLMIEQVNEALTGVRAASDEVDAGSGQISDASQSLSQGATESAASLQEISSSMTEIGSQTKLNAENATQANNIATETKSSAEVGNQRMQEMVTAMSAIEDSSKQIAKIIKVIDDIAFQTNLLALNAAVEAARAGRHGKGFAVVADEVRNLAGRSATAAKETADMIEDSIGKVDAGTQIAQATEKALQEIVSHSVKVADLVGEIAAASNEQAQGIAQIGQGLEQIDKVTQQNTASAEETAAAAEELSGQSRELTGLLVHFKLKDESGHSSFAAIPQKKRARKRSAPAALPASGNSGPTPSELIALDDDEFGRF